MVVCVTGQMAAGKNFICSQFEKGERTLEGQGDGGWISLDADKIVHQAVEDCKEKILETFGETAKEKGIEILDADGKIIRRKLGEVLFGDAELLKKQEEIVHPYVTDYVKKFISENTSNGKTENTSGRKEITQKNIIINATVLYKTPDVMKMCEKIIFVKASFLKRLFRAKRRDKMPVRKIIERFKSQRDLFSCYEKTGVPIEVIRN